MPEPTDDGGGTHFRRQPRSGGRVAVRFRGAGADGTGRTANLGSGGAFVETDGPPPPAGTALSLEVDLPSRAAPLALAATVRWVAATDSGEGMGVEFVAPGDEALATLAEFVGTLTATFDHDDLE